MVGNLHPRLRKLNKIRKVQIRYSKKATTNDPAGNDDLKYNCRLAASLVL